MSELARIRYREGVGLLGELSGEAATSVEKMKKDIDRGGDSSVEATAAKLLDVREPKYSSARRSRPHRP
jgi:hypothetical protein